MGAALSSVISDLTSDSGTEVKEQLEILQEMAHNVVAAESNRMAAKAFEDNTLPIVAIVDTKSFTSVDAKSGCGEDVNNVVGSLFDGKFMKGFKEAVTTVLNTFLGNAQAGKQENREFHVVFDRNALLRIDLYFFKYGFFSEGLKQHGQNLFCYVVQVGVLDSMKVNPQVTLFEVSKSIGSQSAQAKEMLEENADFVGALFKELEFLRNARKELE